MSAIGRQARWDRRRDDRHTGRRHDTVNGSGERAAAEAALADFQAFLDSRLQPLEQAAAVTAGEIALEADRIRGQVGSSPAQSNEIDRLADRLSQSTATMAEDLANLRSTLAASRGISKGATSEGVELLVRQMAIAGAGADEIEHRLAELGVVDPREGVERILADYH